MNYLSLWFLTSLNQYMVLRFGGSYYSADQNVANRNSLEYLVEFVQGDPAEDNPIPRIYWVAAEYAHRIITRHVFHDGNKRTGMEAMLVFLQWNGVACDFMSGDLTDMALDIAQNRVGVADVARWLQERIGL